MPGVCIYVHSSSFIIYVLVRLPGEPFEVSGWEYADDTALIFGDRETAARMLRAVIAHFLKWGMQVHEMKPLDTKAKTMVLFCAAHPRMYRNPTTFDGADLSPFPLPHANRNPEVDEAKYLGSILSGD